MQEENLSSHSHGRKNQSNKKVILVAVIVVVALALLAGGAYAYKYIQDQNAKIERLSDPQQAAKDEATRVKDLVAQLADVPADESPTVATVNDASKLQSQAFFKNAKNGDKVLIFTKAKKAYLYRPSTNKLIEVAPINIGDSQKQSETPASTTTTTTKTR